MNDLEPLPIIIKLYGKQRLYDGAERRYRSLDELRCWRVLRVPFSIVDATTGDDATDRILAPTLH